MTEVNDYHNTVNLLRKFFDGKGFIEVHTQNQLSILAACEDPRTISTYDYAGKLWPLPQTGQMWLEQYLLDNPNEEGFYCVSTSYRNEPNPIPGRHDLIFPMFEFESRGDINDLRMLECALLEHLGILPTLDKYEVDKTRLAVIDYEWALTYLNVKEIGAEEEGRLRDDIGNVIMLQRFPEWTSPFWNMKTFEGYAAKIDVIIKGVETIGSAERATDVDEMRESFHTISDGMYADILYSRFGKDRVEVELEKFLANDFFPRFGGGIGLTRLIRALDA